jgi:hypothetical protein
VGLGLADWACGLQTGLVAWGMRTRILDLVLLLIAWAC